MYVYLAYESYKLHFVCIEFIKKYKKISVSDPLHSGSDLKDIIVITMFFLSFMSLLFMCIKQKNHFL